MTPEKFLFAVSAVYFTAGMIDLFICKLAPVPVLQGIYVLVLASPLVVKPIGRMIGYNRR